MPQETLEELKANGVLFLARCAASGQRAYQVGRTPKECPLAKGSDARAAWLRGYRKEKRAHKPH